MSELHDHATAFAREISEAVSAFVDRPVPFKATSSGSRFVVTDDIGGIVIPVGEGGRISLEATYRCQLDGIGRYLKVLSSKVLSSRGVGPRATRSFVSSMSTIRHPGFQQATCTSMRIVTSSLA